MHYTVSTLTHFLTRKKTKLSLNAVFMLRLELTTRQLKNGIIIWNNALENRLVKSALYFYGQFLYNFITEIKQPLNGRTYVSCSIRHTLYFFNIETKKRIVTGLCICFFVILIPTNYALIKLGTWKFLLYVHKSNANYRSTANNLPVHVQVTYKLYITEQYLYYIPYV